MEPADQRGVRTLRRGVGAGLAAAGALVVLVAAGAPAGAASGSSGSFTFSGQVSGTLAVPRHVPDTSLASCNISPSQGGTDVITWDDVHLKVGSQEKKISFINLQLQVSKFGHSYSMKPSGGTALGTVYFADNASFQWTATSGTITTAKDGSSGSVHGVLAAPGYHAGTVTIKGTWAGCAKIKG